LRPPLLPAFDPLLLDVAPEPSAVKPWFEPPPQPRKKATSPKEDRAAIAPK
jgi:hypothetical protein